MKSNFLPPRWSLSAMAILLVAVVVYLVLNSKVWLSDPHVDIREKSHAAKYGNQKASIGNLNANDTGAAKFDKELQRLQIRLKAARQSSDVVLRAQECADIIGSMCKAGYTAEAYASISEAPGVVRSAELYAYFKHARLPVDELAVQLKTLPYRNEVLLNFGALFDESSVERALEIAKSDSIKKALASTEFETPQTLIGNSLATYLSNRNRNEGLTKADRKSAVKIASDWVKEGLISNANFGTVLHFDSILPAKEKWDIVSRMEPDTTSETVSAMVRNGILEKLMIEDATSALPSLVAKTDAQSLEDLGYAFGFYATLEPAKAHDWYQTKVATLTTTQQDKIALGFAHAALRISEYDSAAAWIAKISDQEHRTQLEKQLPGKKAN